jgi:hypothetical protein
MAAFGMGLLGGIALIIVLAVGLNVLTGSIRHSSPSGDVPGGDSSSALGDLPRGESGSGFGGARPRVSKLSGEAQAGVSLFPTIAAMF